MLKLKFIVFIAFLISYFPAFSSTPPYQVENLYIKKNNQIYADINDGEIIVDADLRIFKILKESKFYATDKENVFYIGKKLEKLNPKNLTFLGGMERRYEHSVFSDDGYIKDKNYVYYNGDLVEGADSNTFELLQYNVNMYNKNEDDVYIYAKDKNYVYINNKKLDVDLVTAQLLEHDDYLIDKNGIYFRYNKLEGANPNNFEKVFLRRFLVSGKHVFFLDKKTNIDPDTLRFEGDFSSHSSFLDSFEHYYINVISDKNNIYFENKRELVSLNPEDIDTFSFLYDVIESKETSGFDIYAKDKKSYYKIHAENLNIIIDKVSKDEVFNAIKKDRKQKEASTFFDKEAANKKLLNKVIINPEDNILFYDKQMMGDDTKYFSTISGYLAKNNLLYQAKNYSKYRGDIYLNGEKMEYDAATFKLLSGDYSSDKNGVYFKDKKINEVDPRDFQIKSMSDHPNSIYKKFLISNNAVFIHDKKIALDADSFEILASKYNYLPILSHSGYSQITLVRDKNSIYLVNDNGEVNALNIKSPSSFEILSNTLDEIYAKDLLHHYRITIKDKNIFNFEQLDPYSDHHN